MASTIRPANSGGESYRGGARAQPSWPRHGMALGGWMSGTIFDFTGSYQAAFLNGLGWNLVNVSIMAWLLLRSRCRPASPGAT